MSEGGDQREEQCEDLVDQGALGRIGMIHGGMGVEASRKGSIHAVFNKSVASTSKAPLPLGKIVFTEKDMLDHEDPFCDALVIAAVIKNYTVSQILMDNGSSVNVVFKKSFEEMKVEPRRVLASDGPLVGSPKRRRA